MDVDEYAGMGLPGSPDGQYIVFGSERGGSPDLYIMRSDASDVVALDTGEGGAGSPVRSPDGRYIAFESRRDGKWQIYRVDAPALDP